MKSFVGIILFFFSVHLTKAQELFIHNESASNIPKGVLGIRLFGNSFNEIDVRRNMFALRWMYGVTPKLSFYLTTTFSNHHGANLPSDLITHRHSGSQTIYYPQQTQKGVTYPLSFNGFHLYTKYRFLTFDDANEHLRIAAFGQWSNVSNAHDEAEPNLLDDTKGYGGGLIVTYLIKRFAVSLTTGFTSPGDYSERVPLFSGSAATTNTTIEYGRSFEYNLSFGYLLYPKKYISYEQTNWNVYLELNGKSYETAVVSQDGSNLEVQTEGLTNGYYVEIHPGIQKVISSNLRINLSAGTNILNTSYTRFYPIFMVSIQRYFYSLKRLK